MERFYYTVLPREGLIFGAVAYIDDRPAGFVVATHDPAGFMRAAVRRRWLLLIGVIGTSVLLAPRSIKAVWEAGRVMMSRHPVARNEQEGEILSFGVVPTYREPSFIRQVGLRLSHDLLEQIMTQFRARGIQMIRATVSAENTPAKLFYSGLGWTLNQTGAPGWRHPTVEFVGHI